MEIFRQAQDDIPNIVVLRVTQWELSKHLRITNN